MDKDLFENVKWYVHGDTLCLDGDNKLIPSIGDINDIDNADTATDYLAQIDGAKEYPWANEGNHIRNIDIFYGTLNIPKYAFRDFYALESVNIPASVRLIEDNAFENCNRLFMVSMINANKSELQLIGHSAFRSCSFLENFYFSPTIKNIGEAAFANSSLNGFLNLPKNANIEPLAFAFTGIAAVIAKNNVLGENAFAGCKFLDDIDADNTLFDKCSASDCARLYAIEANNSIFKRDAIINCNALRELYFDNDIVDESAFYRCSNDIVIKKIDDNTLLAPNSIITCEQARELDLRKENMAL